MNAARGPKALRETATPADLDTIRNLAEGAGTLVVDLADMAGHIDGNLARQATAAAISKAFEDEAAAGRITLSDLFDRNLSPLAGSDPKQFTARFTAMTDRILPALIEPPLGLLPDVVFCAAVTTDGYLPTHNRRFSHPKRRGDPVWNNANCRNRRLFADRVGLAAGRNRLPFLLQAYRRDMGGGEFAMMKDVSAPITLRGRHRGGLRLAYRVR